jgi:hypothetical protein
MKLKVESYGVKKMLFYLTDFVTPNNYYFVFGNNHFFLLYADSTKI